MRRIKILTVMSVVAAITTTFYVSSAQERARTYRSILGEEQYAKCGLDKLHPDEQRELFSHFGTGPTRSYTNRSAMRYMEKEGWREVRVIGAVRGRGPFEEYWAVVWDNYQLYTLDPFGSVDPPDPGLYWAKNTLSSWTILYPDAREISFSARDLK